jgi:hypothetical protein
MCVFRKIKHFFVCISLLCIYLWYRTDHFGSLRSKREEIIADLLDEMNLANMSCEFLQRIG